MFLKIIYNIEIALEAIQRNKLRGFLTSLGIIFGVGSVIAMLAIGTGAQKEVLEQMELLGTNNVIIQPVIKQKEGNVPEDGVGKEEKDRFSPGLTLQDLQSIKETLPVVEYVSPEIIFETSFIRTGKMRTGKLVGISAEYFDINNFEVIEGGNFTDIHQDESQPVCIIGHDVKTRFFAGENPIGKQIKAGKLWLTVVGVLKKRELSTERIQSLGIRNYNLDVFIPATTMVLRFKNRGLITQQSVKQQNASSGALIVVDGEIQTQDKKNGAGENYHQVDKVIVRVSDTSYSTSVAEVISRMLERRHNQVVDFEIIVPEQLLKQEQRTKQIFNIVLSSIASISLIVGGIGIMNIMLASVVERYREIGVRMAVGAQKKDIEMQFLTEALAISISGGLAGIVLGILLSYIIEATAGIATVVSVISVIVSFGVALLVGVVFGFFPAKKAAQNDPVHALRYE